MTERWLPVVGFDGYEVSDLGHLRSFRTRGGKFAVEPKLLKPVHATSGYSQHGLCRGDGSAKVVLLHRIVLEAFVGPCPDGMECRHFPDRNPRNCELSNLSWGTRQDNADDRQVHGTVSRGRVHGELTKTRTPRGDRHWSRANPDAVKRGSANRMAKLREGNVRVIKMLFSVSGVSDRDIAAVFKVTPENIYHIRIGSTWRHVS